MIKLTRLAPIALTVALVGAVTMTGAQTTPTRVAYVDAQEVLKAHPRGKAAADLREAAEKELQPLVTKIREVQSKITLGSASAAERQQYDVQTKTYQATSQRWQKQIDTALQPIIKDVDAAVAAAAKAQAISMVFDKLAAINSGVVIYASESTNLTDEVIKQVKK